MMFREAEYSYPPSTPSLTFNPSSTLPKINIYLGKKANVVIFHQLCGVQRASQHCIAQVARVKYCQPQGKEIRIHVVSGLIVALYCTPLDYIYHLYSVLLPAGRSSRLLCPASCWEQQQATLSYFQLEVVAGYSVLLPAGSSSRLLCPASSWEQQQATMSCFQRGVVAGYSVLLPAGSSNRLLLSCFQLACQILCLFFSTLMWSLLYALQDKELFVYNKKTLIIF